MQVVQLKDEITAEFSHQGPTNAETEEMSVMTKTTEEKSVRQMSLAVDVVEMESERSKAESNLLAKDEFGLQVEGWHNRPRRQSVKSGRGSVPKKWWTVVVTSSCSMTRTAHWKFIQQERCRTAQ